MWSGGQSKILKMFLPKSSFDEITYIYIPRSCDWTPLDYILGSAVKEKRYIYKLGKIEHLKINIRDANVGIQLHTLENLYED